MPAKYASSRAVTPASGDLLNLVALGAHLVPKNLLSWLFGVLMRVHLPRPLAVAINGTFAAFYKLNLAEAEKPLGAYRSLEDLFTRALKPGLRPLSAGVCSPADGFLARSAAATRGSAVQAKGLDYDLEDLVLGDSRHAASLDLAWYQTVYLAPHNYHRVHAPFAGRVTAIRYLPGQLWPVNQMFVLRLPRLFVRNERLVFDVALATGGRAHVVMVGAYNVGRMTTPLAPELVTNSLDRQFAPRRTEKTLTPPVEVAQGAELGTFMLGSTVIIAYDRQALDGLQKAGFPLVQAAENRPILMGQTLTA